VRICCQVVWPVRSGQGYYSAERADSELSRVSVASRGLDESHHPFKGPVNSEAPELFFRWAQNNRAD
jgi:hypothetical protein